MDEKYENLAKFMKTYGCKPGELARIYFQVFHLIDIEQSLLDAFNKKYIIDPCFSTKCFDVEKKNICLTNIYTFYQMLVSQYGDNIDFSQNIQQYRITCPVCKNEIPLSSMAYDPQLEDIIENCKQEGILSPVIKISQKNWIILDSKLCGQFSYQSNSLTNLMSNMTLEDPDDENYISQVPETADLSQMSQPFRIISATEDNVIIYKICDDKLYIQRVDKLSQQKDCGEMKQFNLYTADASNKSITKFAAGKKFQSILLFNSKLVVATADELYTCQLYTDLVQIYIKQNKLEKQIAAYTHFDLFLQKLSFNLPFAKVKQILFLNEKLYIVGLLGTGKQISDKKQPIIRQVINYFEESLQQMQCFDFHIEIQDLDLSRGIYVFFEWEQDLFLLAQRENKDFTLNASDDPKFALYYFEEGQGSTNVPPKWIHCKEFMIQDISLKKASHRVIIKDAEQKCLYLFSKDQLDYIKVNFVKNKISQGSTHYKHYSFLSDNGIIQDQCLMYFIGPTNITDKDDLYEAEKEEIGATHEVKFQFTKQLILN